MQRLFFFLRLFLRLLKYAWLTVWSLYQIALGAVLVILVVAAFKLMAYQMGGTIAKKKFVMQSSQLILAMLLGVIFFHEAFTSGKLIAIPLVIIGFSLIDDESWQFLRQRVKKLI